MSTPHVSETPLMRSNANRLRHAMTQLQTSAEHVNALYVQWADAVRETAEARVGSAETGDVLTDPVYDRALAVSPRELCRAVQQWCGQMGTELDAWRHASTGSQATRADAEARIHADTRAAAECEAIPDLDATGADERGGGGQT